MLRTKALLLIPVLLAFAGCGSGSGDVVPAPAGGTGGSTTTTGDTTPPSAPSGLAATPDGPFGANLSWQPSSDSGGVTGYSVERCLGAGCRTFAPVAAATGTSFTDIGLDPATSYSYQVRATDAAANLSAYSNVANVMTTAIVPPPPLANLPAWMAGMAIGEWRQVPNTVMSSIEPSTIPSGITGPRSKVDTWTSFAVDTRTSKVYSAANGGHNDYSGNEVDELDLELDSPVWTNKIPPTPNNMLGNNCDSYYADGRPVSRHSYYGVTFNEVNDRIMLFGGAHWCQGGGFHNAISSYNIGANTWSPSNTHGSVPGTFNGVAAYALDPLTGNVYGSRGGNFGRWNRSANTFTTLTPTGDRPQGDESPSAMDTTRPLGANPIGRMLIVAGNSGDRHLYTISTNSFTTITLTGPNAAQASDSSQAGMVYVAAIDRYLIRRDGAGGAVYQVHPSTFEVTPFVTTGGASVPSTLRPYNKFLYVPRLRGVVYVPSYSGNAWFLRVH